MKRVRAHEGSLEIVCTQERILKIFRITRLWQTFRFHDSVVIRTCVRAPRQNSIMERWFRSLRAELTDRTLIWNLEHLMWLLREYESFYNGHRPHRSLDQAAPTCPVPEKVIDLDEFRVRRHDRARGILHEYQQVA
ncbi:integrase core domain-containing protein [Catenulispora yoronensis]|uniref:integrase core domain-containing protein n=1 Tax=Catenulispora yoronensis TaxID=450799 RepID=UPI0031DC36EC